MRGLTPEQIRALSAKVSKIKVLLEIPGLDIHYCTGNVGGRSNNITYHPRQLKIGSIIFGDPTKLKMVVSIDNVDNKVSRKMSNVVASGQTAKLHLISFYPGSSDIIGVITLIDGNLVRCEINSRTANIDISANVVRNRAGALITGSRSCGNKFTDALCKYSGTDTECNHTWMDCFAKGNVANFNGFRFAPVGGMQIMVEAAPVPVGYSGGGGGSWDNPQDDMYQIGDCMWWELLFWGCDEYFDVDDSMFVDTLMINSSEFGAV